MMKKGEKSLRMIYLLNELRKWFPILMAYRNNMIQITNGQSSIVSK